MHKIDPILKPFALPQCFFTVSFSGASSSLQTAVQVGAALPSASTGPCRSPAGEDAGSCPSPSS
jgi:hypothetical protein